MSRLNFKFLVHIDRRWIFLALAASVIIPLLWPPNLPITPSPLTVKFYDTIEKLPSGSYVCMSFDYGPGTKAECQPMAIAALHHLFRRKLAAFGKRPDHGLSPESPILGDNACGMCQKGTVWMRQHIIRLFLQLILLRNIMENVNYNFMIFVIRWLPCLQSKKE